MALVLNQSQLGSVKITPTTAGRVGTGRHGRDGPRHEQSGRQQDADGRLYDFTLGEQAPLPLFGFSACGA